MTLAILIILGVIVYLIIGRTVLIIFDEYDLADTDEWRGVAIVIFPLVALWVLVMEGSEFFSDQFVELMTGKKRNKW